MTILLNNAGDFITITRLKRRKLLKDETQKRREHIEDATGQSELLKLNTILAHERS